MWALPTAAAAPTQDAEQQTWHPHQPRQPSTNQTCQALAGLAQNQASRFPAAAPGFHRAADHQTGAAPSGNTHYALPTGGNLTSQWTVHQRGAQRPQHGESHDGESPSQWMGTLVPELITQQGPQAGHPQVLGRGTTEARTQMGATTSNRCRGHLDAAAPCGEARLGVQEFTWWLLHQDGTRDTPLSSQLAPSCPFSGVSSPGPAAFNNEGGVIYASHPKPKGDSHTQTSLAVSTTVGGVEKGAVPPLLLRTASGVPATAQGTGQVALCSDRQATQEPLA